MVCRLPSPPLRMIERVAGSDFFLRKHIRFNGVQSSGTKTLCCSPPSVHRPRDNFRSLLAIEHPRHSARRFLAASCYFTVSCSSISEMWPKVQWRTLISVGVVGAFSFPGANAAQAVTTCVVIPAGQYPYGTKTSQLKGSIRSPPFRA